ncbi:hypothetical protein QBC39DRAFT_117550 [Podospora conica]|nr:hypothetical protein QBC39DRAFT_117550 [Schizothecium conicum]
MGAMSLARRPRTRREASRPGRSPKPCRSTSLDRKATSEEGVQTPTCASSESTGQLRSGDDGWRMQEKIHQNSTAPVGGGRCSSTVDRWTGGPVDSGHRPAGRVSPPQSPPIHRPSRPHSSCSHSLPEAHVPQLRRYQRPLSVLDLFHFATVGGIVTGAEWTRWICLQVFTFCLELGSLALSMRLVARRGGLADAPCQMRSFRHGLGIETEVESEELVTLCAIV